MFVFVNATTDVVKRFVSMTCIAFANVNNFWCFYLSTIDSNKMAWLSHCDLFHNYLNGLTPHHS